MSDFSKMTEQAAHFQAHLKSADTSATGIHSAFTGTLTALLGVNAASRGLSSLFERWAPAAKIKATLSGLTESLSDLRQKEYHLESEVGKLTDQKTKRALFGLEREFDLAVRNLDVVKRQLKFQDQATALGERRLVASGILLSFAVKTSAVVSEINDSLIEGNAAYSNRLKLTYDTFRIQAMTGSSLTTSVNALKALVRNGYENEQSLARTATLVVKLHDGIGLSVDTAATLAAVVERQVNGSFEQVADTVATIVNNTTLAADEAGRLATSLAQLSAVTRPGGRSDMLPEVISTVSRYESQLRKVGGNIETVERLLAKLTTAEGQLAAGVLGGVSPDFINSARGVDYVMERFRAYSKEMLDGVTDSRVRVLRLEQIGQVFGMSALEVVQLQKSLEDMNTSAGAAVTVQERFQKQWHSANEGIARLTRSLVALLQGGLYPLTVVVNATVNTIADLVQWFSKYKVAAYGAMIAVGIASVYAVDRMVRLGRALWSTAMATNIAVEALNRYRNAQLKNAATDTLLSATKKGPIPVGATKASETAAKGLWESLTQSFNKANTAREAAAKGASALPYRQQLTSILQTLKNVPSSLASFFSGGIGAVGGRIATSIKGGFSGLLSGFRSVMTGVVSSLTPWLSGIARGIGTFLGGIGVVAGSVFAAIAAFGAIFIHYQKKALQAQLEQANSERAYRIQARSMRDQQVAIATSAVRYGDFEQAERARALALKQERRDLEAEGATEARIQARLAIVNKRFEEAETRGSYAATMFQDRVNKTPREIAYNEKEDELQKKIASATERSAAEFKKAREDERAREEEESRRRELDALNQLRFRPTMIPTGY